MMLRRLVALGSMLAVAVGAVAVERVTAEDEPEVVLEVETAPLVGLSDRPAVWFCPTLVAPTLQDAEGAPAGVEVRGTLVLTNHGPRPALARLTVNGASSPPSDQLIEIDAYDRVEVPADALTGDELAGVTVETDSAAVTASRLLDLVAGSDSARCASSLSTQWFAAVGATRRDADEVLAVYNPLPDDAVIDISVSTEVEPGGTFSSDELTGIVVSAGRVGLIDLGELVRRREQLSVSVSARSGRVVVDRLFARDGSEGQVTSSVSLLSAGRDQTWFLPSVQAGAGIASEVVVYNPSDRPAEVDVEALGELDVAPVQRLVPARSHELIEVGEGGMGVIDERELTVAVRALTDVSVVVEAETRVLGGEQPGPGPPAGDVDPATPVAAEEWVVPTAVVTDEGATVLVVHHPGLDEVTVELIRFDDGRQVLFDRFELGTGATRRVDLGGLVVDRTGLLVRATGAVVVGSGGPAEVTGSARWVPAYPLVRGGS